MYSSKLYKNLQGPGKDYLLIIMPFHANIHILNTLYLQSMINQMQFLKRPSHEKEPQKHAAN